MVVDFALKRTPSFRVASITRVGPWREDNLRTEFRALAAWATRHHLKTGHWIFFERGQDRWEACLEVRGSASVEGRIRRKTIPATWVASVVFDPTQVSSRIVYHALRDWTRWRKKDRTIRSVTGVREVYPGDPWSEPRAWARCDVQFVVKK